MLTSEKLIDLFIFHFIKGIKMTIFFIWNLNEKEGKCDDKLEIHHVIFSLIYVEFF